MSCFCERPYQREETVSAELADKRNMEILKEWEEDEEYKMSFFAYFWYKIKQGIIQIFNNIVITAMQLKCYYSHKQK